MLAGPETEPLEALLEAEALPEAGLEGEALPLTPMEGVPATERDDIPPGLDAPAAGDEAPRGAEPVEAPVPGLEATPDEAPGVPVEVPASEPLAFQLLGLAECGWQM